MKKYTLILVLILAVSCSKQHRVEEHTINTEQSDNNIINEALKAMEMIYGSGTKSMSKGFSYHNIIPATKSNPDMSLHVVNFEENSGFVAFAGNEEDPILLGISNNGNLNIEALENNLSSPQSYFLPIDTPENEVDDPEDMPYYDNDTTSIESSDFTDFIHIEDFNLSDPSTDLYFGPVEGLMADNMRFLDGMEEFESLIGDIDPDSPPVNWGTWENHLITRTLIKSKWHQRDPYNRSCPLNIEGTEKAQAGCTAIGVGQIAAFYNLPASENWNVISKFDTYESGNLIYNNHTLADSLILADYVYQLGLDLNINYPSMSGSDIYDVRRYLRTRMGFIDARINQWNWPRAKERIRYGIPVLMSGKGSVKSHLWIVDGYITQVRQNNHYPFQRLYRDLMHINWGQRGWYDGYYFIGQFNVSEGPEKLDKDSGDVRATPIDTAYYNRNLKLLTWSNY